MQLHLLNTHTKFETSILKNVDVTSKKQISIAKFRPNLQNAGDLGMGENSFSHNSLTDRNFQIIFLLMN